MMAVRNRLIALIDERATETGKRPRMRDIARQTNISPETLYSYMRQEPARFDGKVLEGLCRYFNVGIEKLIYFDPPINAEGQR
jgi:transcriptional regulator with XRE-family HTH domain